MVNSSLRAITSLFVPLSCCGSVVFIIIAVIKINTDTHTHTLAVCAQDDATYMEDWICGSKNVFKGKKMLKKVNKLTCRNASHVADVQSASLFGNLKSS